jgi:hypothetical protein
MGISAERRRRLLVGQGVVACAIPFALDGAIGWPSPPSPTRPSPGPKGFRPSGMLGAAVRSLPVRATLALASVLLLSAGTAEADGRVHPDPQSVEPLAPGARVPSVRVQAVGGERIDLAERVREQGALLVFYRGGW